MLQKKKMFFYSVSILLLLAFLLSFFILRPLPAIAGIPVLNYHQVNDDSYTVLTLSSYEFNAQMKYLEEADYTSITPDQLVDYLKNNIPLPPNPVLITFDDGYEDNYRVAYPILVQHHLTATIFLISDYVNKNPHYLTWEQVHDMQQYGITFGSHTVHHKNLVKLSDTDIQQELQQSRRTLEDNLRQPVKYLAYPGGMYNAHIAQLAKETGYHAAFTIQLGRDQQACNLFTLNRIPIFARHHSFLHFWLRLQCTQFLLFLQHLKDILNQYGATSLSAYLPTP